MEILFQCVVLVSCFCSAFSASPLLTEPYSILWQVPSQQCQRADIGISYVDTLSTSKIIFNQNDVFVGENVAILYENELGFWPYYDDDGTEFYGGIPERGNLTAHLNKANTSFTQAIPNADFDGSMCINMEKFRPQWEQNFSDKRIYQINALSYTRSLFAALNPSGDWVLQEATDEFEYSAKKFMQETLRLGTSLRPNGLWGYYNYPYCFNRNPVTFDCAYNIQEGNSRITWLWEGSTAIMPSIYVFNENWSFMDSITFMYGNIVEALRVGDLVGGRPVLVYTKTKYNATLPVIFMREIDMLASLRIGADFGVEGTVVWGSRGDFQTKMDCAHSLTYLRTAVAPYAENLLTFTKLCSTERCSGRGRCRHRGTLDRAYVNEVLRVTMDMLTDWTIDDKYSCNCYKGYGGKDCSSIVSGACVQVRLSLAILIISTTMVLYYLVKR